METTLNFKVEGMTCGGCARSVRSALESVPGVTVEQVLIGEPVRVRYDPERASRDDVAAAIEQAGYRPVFAPTS
ncbi:MAG TPA: heavy-metal-associated domain-containing protein [Rubricoccaceae bacterium]|nr:heavy-metal-associated domain-containing protein [Rubricoccaceae bacterium]